MTFSRLMLGTVQFGMPYGIANTRGMPDDGTVCAILKEAYDSGITSLDTSADYDLSEERLGAAIGKLGLSGRFEVVTKIPRVPDGLSDAGVSNHIEFYLARSLKRLRLERLAAALFHTESDAVYLPLLEARADKGDIGMAGVSLDSAAHPPAARKARCVQIPSNLLDRRFDSYIDTAERDRRVVFARSVFLQGLLLMPDGKVPPHLRAVIDHRKRLADLTKDSGYTFPQLAFGYLYSQAGVTSVVFGVDSVEQLRENIRLTDSACLPDDLLKQLRQAVGPLPERVIRPGRWGSQNPT